MKKEFVNSKFTDTLRYAVAYIEVPEMRVALGSKKEQKATGLQSMQMQQVGQLHKTTLILTLSSGQTNDAVLTSRAGPDSAGNGAPDSDQAAHTPEAQILYEPLAVTQVRRT